MTQAILTERATAIIEQLADATGVPAQQIADIVNRERRRVSCLTRGVSRDEVAERIARWFATASHEREELNRLGLLAWQAKKSEAFAWATLHGLKRNGWMTVKL